jgi:hypothetical protein
VQEKDNPESLVQRYGESSINMELAAVKTLDSDPYKIIKVDLTLEIKSERTRGQFLFTKIIGNSSNENSFKLDFKNINEGEKSSSVWPWQITRVKKGELFFSDGRWRTKKKIFFRWQKV